MRNLKNDKKTSIMLDSGAFSAWTQEIEINIDEYCQYCLNHLNIFDYIVNLDIIPGKPGMKNISKEEKEKCAFKGYKNYYYMLEKGIPKEKLIHIFHQGEDFKWLKKMVKEIEYIGLSPANDKSIKEKISWLDLCMMYVTDKQGRPIVKFHGFGVTAYKILFRYPWYSVDSTAWISGAKYGKIFIPLERKHNDYFTNKWYQILISNRKLFKNKILNTRNTYTSFYLKEYLNKIKYKLGISEFRIESLPYSLKFNEKWIGKKFNNKRKVEKIIEEGVSNSYKLRVQVNIEAFKMIENNFLFKKNYFKHKKGFK